MPTNQDETLQQRYTRDHQDYLKTCGSMTAEQVADLQLRLNNAPAGEAALREELACFKAVLVGMEFQHVNEMPADGVYLCTELGKESARIVKGIQAERNLLRDELATAENACKIVVEEAGKLSERQTIAEQRNAELVELLRMAWGSDDVSAVDCRRIDAACAKPTESGASE